MMRLTRGCVLLLPLLLTTAAPTGATEEEDCLARKLRAVSSEAKRRLACEARARAGGVNASDCAERAAAKRDQRFARIEADLSCDQTGDSDAVGAEIERAVVRALAVLAPTCGDGIRAISEACDGDDDQACPGACTEFCSCPACGDGVVDPGEDCDPGLNGTSGGPEDYDWLYFFGLCRSNCQFATDTCSDQGMLCYFKPDDVFFTQIDCCDGLACDYNEAIGPYPYVHCRPACETQDDCSDGATCEDGVCTRFPSCASDDDCPAPFLCLSGYDVCGCPPELSFLCSDP